MTHVLTSPLRFGFLGLATLAFLLVPFALWGEAIEAWTLRQFAALGPAGAALIGGGLLSLDILLPVPSSIVGVFLGAALGMVKGTLFGTLGLTLGCLLGYGLGRVAGTSLTGCLVTTEEIERGRSWLRRYGLLALALLRPVPVLAEASVLAVGMLRLSPPAVLLVTAFSNLAISAAYAAIGAAAHTLAVFGFALAAALAIPAAALATVHFLRRRPR